MQMPTAISHQAGTVVLFDGVKIAKRKDGTVLGETGGWASP
jgi:hypothetical protein